MSADAKTIIRRRAIELGFDACQFTTATPPESARHFRDWLAAGRQGTMSYLERTADRRVNPAAVLPGAASVIVLAASYPAGEAAPEPVEWARSSLAMSRSWKPESRGGVARYARFRDYHEVFRRKLLALVETVDIVGGPDTRSRAYVDTGPVLERDLARRAGMGFIGKHTNLIRPSLGNWFFIAEVLTTLVLAPDAPARNRCGKCTRCIAACPTQAIVAPYQLDARRCISYLTIESRGPIPIEFRPLIGARVFGCDACLEVCPWNRFAAAGGLLARTQWTDDSGLVLLDLLALDHAGFRRRFRRTPIERIKLSGLRRNVCVALGNVANADALPALERAAFDPDQLVAEHASWAVGRIRERSE